MRGWTWVSILSVPYGRESSIMIVLSILLALLDAVVVKDSLALLKQDKRKAIKETHVDRWLFRNKHCIANVPN